MVGIIISAVVSLAVGGVASYFISSKMLEKKLGNAKNIAEKTIKDAEEKASSIKKEAVLEAKEEVLKLKTDTENECRERRNEIQKMESRILEKEENLGGILRYGIPPYRLDKEELDNIINKILTLGIKVQTNWYCFHCI